MRKNVCLFFAVMATFLVWGLVTAYAVAPGGEDPKYGAVWHSLAPDSSEVGDSLVTDISAIVCTWWRQLAPCFNTYHIVDYRDNPNGTPDGMLSTCDYIQADLRKMADSLGAPEFGYVYFDPGAHQRWYHVDVVTITLKLKRQTNPVDSLFVEYVMPPVNYLTILQRPVFLHQWRTYWPPEYPGGTDTLVSLDSATTDAGHSTPANVLQTCIYIHLAGDDWWHVEDVAIDIVVHRENPPPVPGPTLTEWGLVILVALIVGSAIFIMVRRRRAAVPA